MKTSAHFVYRTCWIFVLSQKEKKREKNKREAVGDAMEKVTANCEEKKKA